MQFTSYLENGHLTIALSGEIDHHRAKSYMRAISAKLEAYVPRVCVLDFREVGFVDSSGIAVVIGALRTMKKIGGQLQISNLGPQPLKVFRTSGIDKLIDIQEVVS